MGRVTSLNVRDGYAELDEVRLHYVEAGEGPLVVLLHGFPEFWYSWRGQIEPLAAAGFRVVAPDMRGYNLSSKPNEVGAYALEHLAGDIRDLIRERGEESARVAGHDWGGEVAWGTAMFHPQAVERLAILNAPHPRRFAQGVLDPRQLARSWYFLLFALPWLAERIGPPGFRRTFAHDAAPGAFSAADLERYEEAWAQPGALTGGLNYYRALFREPPWATTRRLRRIDAPTLVIWGERDRHLRAQLAEPARADVPNLEGVVRLNTSHWVQHDEPAQVARLLAEFFAG
jgi:pimeloyl-ACP methyl ester carboxylesterase